MAIMFSVQFQVKMIPLTELNYWNVDLQEAYYSAVEADKKYKKLNK